MVTGFDILGHDSGLRRHWKNRFFGFFIDAAVAFIPTSIVLYLLNVEDLFTIGLATSVVFYLSTTIVESLNGASIGKKIMGLSMRPAKGDSIAGRTCIRNLDRLFWFMLPPLNFALGMAMRGDPRQTALDHLAGTKVVHREETEAYDNHIQFLEKANENDSAQTNQKDACQECGGKLMLLPDSKLQCEKCGLIQ
jgi:uncharacterized RDD family membrane protein YckC/ribosomal protein S27AE